MFVGPVFTREVVTVPRRTRLYIARATYVSALLILMSTAWLILAGTQVMRNVGDLARFGAILFGVLAPLQLALAVFFSALLAASAVAQEKDRRTLVLLLLTNLSNSELVLGKLLAGMLNVLVLLAASLPLFALVALFGGVSFEQIARVFAVMLASALAAGSLGSTLALWREKTFQTLALSILALVLWLAFGELIAHGAWGATIAGAPAATWAAALSPWRAIMAAARPTFAVESGAVSGIGSLGVDAVTLFVVVAFALAAALNVLAILLVRVWNPSRETRASSSLEEENESILSDAPAGAPATAVTGRHTLRGSAPARSVHAAPGRTRAVWDNPIVWREMRTWAYGRKILVIRLAYLLLFALAAGALYRAQSDAGLTRAAAGLALVPLCVLSLVLVNAQAVTSLTTERDVGALDLLLVTDLSAKEFVFGKLLGVFYNTKEMILLPIALCGYLWYIEALTLENFAYLAVGLLVMNVFVAMVGVHTGMNYTTSRTAIATSLGTVFFLFLGVATCMRMMVAFSGSFQFQLQPFLAFMLGGGVGLYLSLGARNPSSAIFLASFACPFATFYEITSFLLHYTLSVFLVTLVTYGFATAAMLVPAIYEFDVATGRTTAGSD